jgi:transposase
VYSATGGLSNGPTEATTLLIEKVRQVGHGYRNFDNYRLRLLLYCGFDWQTPSRPRSEVGYPALVA